MPILSTTGSSSAKAYGLGGYIIVPGNSGIITSSTTFVVPVTAGPLIKVLAIGTGGGGGGGSSRNGGNSGYNNGGGGGGAGDIRYATVDVKPNQSFTVIVGGGGGAGGARDGVYSSGSNGADGAYAIFQRGIFDYPVYANGGYGGAVAGTGTGGATPNTTGAKGTQVLTPSAGTSSTTNRIGGASARGYTINTTIGVATPYGYGSAGTGGIGDTGTAGTAGTVYGGGGGGGGCNFGSDVAGDQAASGSTGAVFIWWGY